MEFPSWKEIAFRNYACGKVAVILALAAVVVVDKLIIKENDNNFFIQSIERKFHWCNWLNWLNWMWHFQPTLKSKIVADVTVMKLNGSVFIPSVRYLYKYSKILLVSYNWIIYIERIISPKYILIIVSPYLVLNSTCTQLSAY